MVEKSGLRGAFLCSLSLIHICIDILIAANGLKYYDIEEGKGPVAEKGSTVQVICLGNLRAILPVFEF